MKAVNNIRLATVVRSTGTVRWEYLLSISITDDGFWTAKEAKEAITRELENLLIACRGREEDDLPF